MAKQHINIGQSANDKSGDLLRTAFNKINENFTELYSTGVGELADRLANGDYEVVLGSNGVTTFPELEGENLFIQGPEIGSTTSSIAVTSVNEILLRTDALTNTKLWVLDKQGTITTPVGIPTGTIRLTFDPAKMIPDPIAFAGEGDLWYVDIQFQIAHDASVSIVVDGLPHYLNPGYVNGHTFRFTEEDHGVPGFDLDVVLSNIQNPGDGLWTSNYSFTQPPVYPSTISTAGAVKLSADGNNWVFGTDGVLNLPAGGDIQIDGQTVLGNGSITIFDTHHSTNWVNTTELQIGDNLTVTGVGDEGSGVLRIDAAGGSNTGNVQFDGGGMFVPTDDTMSLSNSTSDLDMNYITLGQKTLDIYAYNNTTNNGAQISFDNSSEHALAQITVTDNSLNQYWTFNADGSTAFPSDLKVWFDQDGTSILSRENVVDNGFGGFDSFYTNIKLTPDYTIIETTNDPDGLNNERIGRITTSDTTVLLESIQRDVGGEIGSSINLTASGITMDAGDGVTQSSLLFDGGGLLINNYGVLTAGDDVYLKAIQTTTLNLSAGELLESLENDWINTEALYDVTIAEDAAMISPETRPWAGLHSYEAYAMIIDYIQNVPGGVLPPSSSIVPVTKTASDAFYAWNAALGVAKVNVNVGTKTWTFDGTGVLQLPENGVIKNSSGNNIVPSNLSNFNNDLEINANTLTGTTIAENVTGSSLTSVGTLEGLTSSGVVHITNTEDSTNADTGSLQVDGGAHVTKNLIAEGTIYAGKDAYSEALTNPLIVASSPSGVAGGYSQVAILNNTAEASGDFQVMIDGYDVNVSDTGWADLGMAGSNFSDERYTITNPGDGYVFVSGKESSTNGGNLVLATDNSGTSNDLVFATGGFTYDKERMRFNHADNKFYIGNQDYTADLEVAGDTNLRNTYVTGDVSIDSNYQLYFSTEIGTAASIAYSSIAPALILGTSTNINLTAGGDKTWILDYNGNIQLPVGGDIKNSNGDSVLSAAYTLPTASTDTLGGVKVDGTTIVIVDGVISNTGAGFSYTLPTASTGTLGGVKIDGTTISIASGVISAVIPTNISTFVNDANYLTSVTTITGNAGTATKLATARNINGVAFDGTGDITVAAAASTLSGSTLNAGVTGSSLTSVGTLTNLTVTNTITGSVTGSAGSVAGTNLTGTTLASGITSSSLTSVGTLANLTVTNTITGSVSGNAGTVSNGVYTTDTGTVTNAMLAGSIANSKLANSSITINGTAVSLGGSISAGLPADTFIVATQAGSTQLTSSMYRIITTGSVTTFTYILPDTNTCTVGQSFFIVSPTQNYAFSVLAYNGSTGVNISKTITPGLGLVATVVTQRGGTSADVASNWSFSWQGNIAVTGTGQAVMHTSPLLTSPSFNGTVDASQGALNVAQVGEKFSSWNYAVNATTTAVPTAVASGGVFTIPSTTGLSLGQAVTITGTLGGTGSITGYTTGTTYYIISTVAAGGATSVTLSAARNSGTSVTTSAGTISGLTMTFGAQVGPVISSGGTIVNVTGTIGANFDVSVTSNYTANYAYSVTLIINQGATPYMINNFYIGSLATYASAAQTISWAGGSAPSGTANKKDVITLSWLPSSAYGASVVLGQLQSYG